MRIFSTNTAFHAFRPTDSSEEPEFAREGKGLESVWDDKIHPVILGDETFVESIYEQHVDEATTEIAEISRLERRLNDEPIESYFKDGADRAVWIAAAYRSGKFSQREIADYCGAHYSTVSPVSRSLRLTGG